MGGGSISPSQLHPPWVSASDLHLLPMEGISWSLDWQGYRTAHVIIAFSSSALWGSDLFVAGTENQSQQPPCSEEVSSAWQPEEAFRGWEMCRISNEDFSLNQATTSQGQPSKALQQWSVLITCWSCLLWGQQVFWGVCILLFGCNQNWNHDHFLENFFEFQ